MAVLKRTRGVWALILLLAAGFLLVRERRSVAAGDVTISFPTTFAAADASDGVVDGVFTVMGNLTITGTGNITCNDPGAPASACPITIVVGGNMEMQAGSAILAENTNDGGNGGNLTSPSAAHDAARRERPDPKRRDLQQQRRLSAEAWRNTRSRSATSPRRLPPGTSRWRRDRRSWPTAPARAARS
jgi:hypothetical protein